MAAKSNFKDLLLSKGEKFLLIGSGAVAALLLLWGTLAMAGAGDPSKDKKALDDGAQRLTQKKNDAAEPAVPPEGNGFNAGQLAFKPIAADEFSAPSTRFDVTVWPSFRRVNPKALPPIESQIDLILGSVKKHARDNFIYDKETGDLIEFDGLYLTKLTDSNIDPKKVWEQLREQQRLNRGGRRQAGGPANPPVGPPGGGGLSPGGPGGGGLLPGGPGGGGLPPGGPGGGGSFGGPPGGLGRGGGEEGSNLGGSTIGSLNGTKTSEDVVSWMKFSQAQKDQKLPAYMVFPTRMAVVQLSYPLKAQLEEIQKALRLKSLDDAIYESSPGVLFAKNPENGDIVPYSAISGGSAAPAAMGPGGPGGGLPPGAGGLPPGPGGGGLRPGGPIGGRPLQPGGPGGGLMLEGGAGGSGSGGGTTPTLNSVASPVFAGFSVERKKTFGDGTEGNWEPFDHSGRWHDEFRMYDAVMKVDTGHLPYLMRMDQGLVAPMPELAPNWTSKPQEATLAETHYPEWIRMPSMVQDFQTLNQKNAKPVTRNAALNAYRTNPNNPYNPGPQSVGSLMGQPGGGEEGRGAGGGPGFYGPGGGRPGGGPLTPGGPGGGMTLEGPNAPAVGQPGAVPPANALSVNHLLIRFVDTDLEPGASYRYRVAVKIRNPNFAKKDKVSDDELASKEFIVSEAFECTQTLTVPGESHLYAYSPKLYEQNVLAINKAIENPEKDPNKNGPNILKKLFELDDVTSGRRAVVQMQRWVSQTNFAGEKEPIGAWVQAEIPVAPGEYIGKKALVELPLWKAALGKYVFSPTSRKLVSPWVKDLPQPIGRPVEFRTEHVLLDFQGGKVSTQVDVGGNRVSVQDDAATELLILRKDGKIEVRKELEDAVKKDRLEREKGWKAWVETVKKQSPNLVAGPGSGPFGPGRGGTGGGGGDN